MQKVIDRRLITHLNVALLFRPKKYFNNVNYTKYLKYTTSAYTSNSNFNTKRPLKDIHLKLDDLHIDRVYENNNEDSYIKNSIQQNVLNIERNIELLNNCNDAYQLVNVVNQIGQLTQLELELIGKKALQMISNDMKQNSILLLTLNEFGIDLAPFLGILSTYQFTNNEHIILRSLSELKTNITNDQIIEHVNSLFDKYFNKLNELTSISALNDVNQSYVELYNYICSYCNFISKGVITNLTHLNTIESFINTCFDTILAQSYGDDVSNKPYNKFNYFTVAQLVDMCYNLACVRSDSCKVVLRKLHEMNFYKMVHHSELLHMFSKLASYDDYNCYGMVELVLLDLYKNDDFKLSLEDCLNLVVAIGKSRKFGIILTDILVEDIKKHTNDLELEHIAKILINLSKINYNNKGFVRHMANLILTFVDEDSIIDPFILSNIIKGFGRFHYYNNKLIDVLLTVSTKEEVLEEFQIHDLITIYTSLCKILMSNSISNKSNMNKYLRVLAQKIVRNDLNTDMSISLINASSKIVYNNERFLNSLIEFINLNEVNDLSKLYKLKISSDKLNLYYPELTKRIQSLESNLRPKSDETQLDDDESNDTHNQQQNLDEFERPIYVRNNSIYRNMRLPSVRRRKWTY